MSDNINAFLPGTYDEATGTGTRPNGINENIYQFQSEGIYNQNQLSVNYSVRAKRVTLFGFYMLNFANADTSGATTSRRTSSILAPTTAAPTLIPATASCWAETWPGPYGVSFSPMLVTNSGAPFNITIGQDIYGDNQFNERPAYATASSTDVMKTEWGTFDLNPSASEAIIPYNLAPAPGSSA